MSNLQKYIYLLAKHLVKVQRQSVANKQICTRQTVCGSLCQTLDQFVPLLYTCSYSNRTHKHMRKSLWLKSQTHYTEIQTLYLSVTCGLHSGRLDKLGCWMLTCLLWHVTENLSKHEVSNQKQFTNLSYKNLGRAASILHPSPC